jgi:hypothetical protein
MPEATKAQPWKSVWPASNTTTDKDGGEEGQKIFEKDVKTDYGVPHYKLSGSRSAEFGYEEEVKAEEPKHEKK